jgi:hypothetical protein
MSAEPEPAALGTGAALASIYIHYPGTCLGINAGVY